jgi:transcription termination/antitermination protein NusG
MNRNIASQSVSQELWFAVRVKSRCEKLIANMARDKGFEEFLPLYQCRRHWSDRLKLVEVPLFPGYIFCRIKPERRLPLLTIPGVLHFVGIGKVPIPVDDAEIAAIQAALRSGLSAEPCAFLEAGQRVRLKNGPLAGLEGIIVGDSKEHRIVVSITLLKRSISVAIERHWAKPLKESGGTRAIPIRLIRASMTAPKSKVPKGSILPLPELVEPEARA